MQKNTLCMVFIKQNSLQSGIFIPCFSGSRFFMALIFHGPGFSGSRFFRVPVQVLEVAIFVKPKSIRFQKSSRDQTFR